MGTSTTERAFRSVQLDPASINEIAGCDSDEHTREQSGAIIDCAPRLRQRFPEHVVGTPEPHVNQAAGRAHHRKEAAT